MRSLFIAAMLTCSPALAIEPSQIPTPFCLGEVESTVKMQEFLHSHDGASLEFIEGDKAAAWIEAFNTAAPPTSYLADAIWVVANPKEVPDYLIVSFFYEHKTCYHAIMPVGAFIAVTAHSQKNNH